MNTVPGSPAPGDDAAAASPTAPTLRRRATTAPSPLRTILRWTAVLTAAATSSALLVLGLLERPGHEVVILSVGAVQWRPILHLLFVASMCIALGTVAHQLASAPGGLERTAGRILGMLVAVSACCLVIMMALFAMVASVRQYITITADDGERFLVRAITGHHTDYSVLEPAGGPWYSEGASILTNGPNIALATGAYLLQRTPTGYHLTFSPTPANGTWYQLDW